jgi:purine-binding chemotaxis protein CheW
MSLNEKIKTARKGTSDSVRKANLVQMGKEMQIVLFNLNTVLYGVDVNQVQGVLEMQEITTVPNAPHYIEGVTNLRGDVIPVVDLRKKFGLDSVESETESTKKMMVIGQGESATGVLVDAVMEVLNISKDDVDEVPDVVSSDDTDHMLGVAKHNEDLVILLNLMNVVGQSKIQDYGSYATEAIDVAAVA